MACAKRIINKRLKTIGHVLVVPVTVMRGVLGPICEQGGMHVWWTLCGAEDGPQSEKVYAAKEG